MGHIACQQGKNSKERERKGVPLPSSSLDQRPVHRLGHIGFIGILAEFEF